MRALPLLVLVACRNAAPPLPEPLDFCQPKVVFGADVGAYPGYVGVPKRVQQGILVFGCDGGTPPKVSATARVVDSTQKVIPSQVSLVTGGPPDPQWGFDANNGGTLVVATVAFTPPAPGTYLGSVRFEPSLGVEQFELITVVDRSDGGTHHVQVQGQCDDFDMLGEVALCQLHGKVWASTGAVLTANTFAVDGDDLWAVRDSVLTIGHFDSSGALQIVDSAPLPDGYTPSFGTLLASQGVALLIGSPQVWEARRSLVGVDYTLVANAPYTSLNGVQWSPGDGLIIGQGNIFCAANFHSGAPISCDDKNVFGTDGEVMWTVDGPRFQAWHIDGGMVEQLPLEGYDGFQPLGGPFTRGDAPFAIAGGELMMPTRESPPRLAGYGPVGPLGFQTARVANRHLYWQESPDGTGVDYVFR